MADVPGPPPANDGEDAKAREEANFLSQKPQEPELIAEGRRRHLLQLWSLRDVLFWAARILIRVVIVLVILAIIAWWWHLVGFKTVFGFDVRWLETNEIERLQAIISSGAISALVTILGKKFFFPNDRD